MKQLKKWIIIASRHDIFEAITEPICFLIFCLYGNFKTIGIILFGLLVGLKIASIKNKWKEKEAKPHYETIATSITRILATIIGTGCITAGSIVIWRIKENIAVGILLIVLGITLYLLLECVVFLVEKVYRLEDTKKDNKNVNLYSDWDGFS